MPTPSWRNLRSSAPRSPRSTLRRAGVASIACLLLASTLAACQLARVGARCTGGAARSSSHVLLCKDGRWSRWLTFADYARLVEANRAVAAAAAGAAPAPATSPAGTAGSALDPTPVRSWRIGGVGWAALKVGNVVYVGGEFSTVRSPDGGSSQARSNVAAFDAATGALLPFRGDANGKVTSLATDGTRLFVGGNFTRIGGAERRHLAALDLATGAAQAWWRADADDNVYALWHAAGRLFVAGNFTTIAGQARLRTAALDASTAAVSGFTAHAAGGGVDAIAATPDGSRVYLGGTFASVNGTPTSLLTAVDANGSVLPIRFAAPSSAIDVAVGPGGGVLAAFGQDDDLTVWFDPRTGAAAWRVHCDGDGQAVHPIGGHVFSGFHQSCAGDPSAHLVTTNVFGQLHPFKPAFDRFWGVRDIAGDAEALVIAGDFTQIDGVPVGGFAIYRPAP